MPTVPETRVRERTRRAILLAGIAVLVDKPSAPVGEVADAAGVARSTLHRYFPDRDALVAGIEAFTDAEYALVVADARIDSGSGRDAYERLVGALLDRSSVFAWWSRANAPDDEYDDNFDASAVALIERGHRDGSLDMALDAQWVVTTTWSTLWSVHYEIGRGQRTARELKEMCVRGLLKLVSA